MSDTSSRENWYYAEVAKNKKKSYRLSSLIQQIDMNDLGHKIIIELIKYYWYYWIKSFLIQCQGVSDISWFLSNSDFVSTSGK